MAIARQRTAVAGVHAGRRVPRPREVGPAVRWGQCQSWGSRRGLRDAGVDRTRMRPLVVKRQTTPRSGLWFFSAGLLWAPSASGAVRCLHGPRCGTDGPWLPHTRLAVLSPWRWRWQRRPRQGALATSRAPQPVRRTREAARLPCARALQARGRGSPRASRMAARGPGGPVAGARRGCGPRDEAARGDPSLAPWAAWQVGHLLLEGTGYEEERYARRLLTQEAQAR